MACLGKLMQQGKVVRANWTPGKVRNSYFYWIMISIPHHFLTILTVLNWLPGSSDQLVLQAQRFIQMDQVVAGGWH